VSNLITSSDRSYPDFVSFVQSLATMERVLTTPLPFAYNIHRESKATCPYHLPKLTMPQT
jgi:predicted membrane chloride channel (bestrophin family)